MTINSFEALPLAEPLKLALRELGYETPSPIQAQAIPPQLEGRDMIGCAQTGTGKTAAFALPILHHLSTRPERAYANCARALVLTPTRELAVQVGESFSRYGRHLDLRHALVYGGVNQHHQVKAMRRGVDVLVATPGRLLDLMNQGHVSLEQVEFLVLDEVDRMLDMGFVHDVRKIAAKMPAKRQTVLFSATVSKEVRAVADRFVRDPVQVRIDPGQPVVERIDQRVCHVRAENKLPLLRFFLSDKEGVPTNGRTLVFSRTKHGADKLSKKLNGMGFSTEAIHGNKTQASRQRALNRFRDGQVPVLVATDVAARGIDVKDIDLVVNFDLPNEADTYVHRIGRTARAEASGRAISFCDDGSLSELGQIERHLGRAIRLQSEHPYHHAGMAKKAFRPEAGGKPGKKGGDPFRRGGGNNRGGSSARPSNGRKGFAKGPRRAGANNRPAGRSAR